jgi:hypothetical protein
LATLLGNCDAKESDGGSSQYLRRFGVSSHVRLILSGDQPLHLREKSATKSGRRSSRLQQRVTRTRVNARKLPEFVWLQLPKPVIANGDLDAAAMVHDAGHVLHLD